MIRFRKEITKGRKPKDDEEKCNKTEEINMPKKKKAEELDEEEEQDEDEEETKSITEKSEVEETDEEDISDTELDEEEKAAYSRLSNKYSLRRRNTAKAESEPEQAPPESSTAQASQTTATITPGFSTPTGAQHIIVPTSSTGAGIGSVESHPMTIRLSADPEFMKSPIGQAMSELVGEISELKKTNKQLEKKLMIGVEDVVKKTLKENRSFLKASAENAGIETMEKTTSAPEFKTSDVRFRY